MEEKHLGPVPNKNMERSSVGHLNRQSCCVKVDESP